MTARNGNEKYGNRPQRRPTTAQQVRTINTGDLMLYGSDCLVLFYERFNTPYSDTRLGRIAVSAVNRDLMEDDKTMAGSVGTARLTRKYTLDIT